jgi:hypothetical protein
LTGTLLLLCIKNAGETGFVTLDRFFRVFPSKKHRTAGQWYQMETARRKLFDELSID